MEMRQIDKSARIGIPAEILEQAGLKVGDYVGIQVNKQTGVLEITPLEIKPKTRS